MKDTDKSAIYTNNSNLIIGLKDYILDHIKDLNNDPDSQLRQQNHLISDFQMQFKTESNKQGVIVNYYDDLNDLKLTEFIIKDPHHRILWAEYYNLKSPYFLKIKFIYNKKNKPTEILYYGIDSVLVKKDKNLSFGIAHSFYYKEDGSLLNKTIKKKGLDTAIETYNFKNKLVIKTYLESTDINNGQRIIKQDIFTKTGRLKTRLEYDLNSNQQIVKTYRSNKQVSEKKLEQKYVFNIFDNNLSKIFIDNLAETQFVTILDSNIIKNYKPKITKKIEYLNKYLKKDNNQITQYKLKQKITDCLYVPEVIYISFFDYKNKFNFRYTYIKNKLESSEIYAIRQNKTPKILLKSRSWYAEKYLISKEYYNDDQRIMLNHKYNEAGNIIEKATFYENQSVKMIEKYIDKDKLDSKYYLKENADPKDPSQIIKFIKYNRKNKIKYITSYLNKGYKMIEVFNKRGRKTAKYILDDQNKII